MTTSYPIYPRPDWVDDTYLKALDRWCQQNGVETLDYWPCTVGVCQLDDLNQLLTRDNRGRANFTVQPRHPSILLVGIFELECLRSIAWSCGTLIAPPKGNKQRHKDAPFVMAFGAGSSLTVYPLKTFSCFRLL